MTLLPILLWSDLLIWLLVLAGAVLGVLSWRNPPLRAAWRRVGRSRPGMASATVLAAFVLVGLLDSLHYRPRLENGDLGQPAAYAIEVLSALDAIAEPLRSRNEKTYSAPLATRAYAKESIEVRGADGRVQTTREFPRLKFGGLHLGEEEGTRDGDVLTRVLTAETFALGILAVVSLGAACFVARRGRVTVGRAWRNLWRGETEFAWNAVLVTLGVLLLTLLPVLFLCVDYHVFGTDKVGQDVFYQILKSVRTALVIGLVTTLVTLPLAIGLGILAGYFRGWVDDVIQYLYTTLSSIPGVLLIAAAVLMMQVVIDTHPQWFATAAERADLRLLALCFILGLTSWTGLCRLLRGETLKLRELEYIQAAQAFGVADFRILLRHIMPNLMHIIIIALVMDFSGLVLAEAVLSYVGIGVDPSMISFGTMINNARMELAREPMVWWSLASAFTFMFALVLAANLLADAVRDAFDPRMAGSS
ncbi:ABC transporter permease [Propionivibrio limicola]|uniref:ABC transporter permease n=1 Tax=Propionivibrio limicola TaxID=167645 RepID=UPI0012914E0A|nr:ABC transporter permease [Propionivibrio limicola]